MRARLGWALGALLLLCSNLAIAHPFHWSQVEAELNPKTRSLELSLRCWPEDLERALSLAAGKRLRLDILTEEEREEPLKAYAAKRCRVLGPEGEALAMRWLGHELEAEAAWLHFEILLPEGGLADCTFEMTQLFEVLDDQKNQLTLRREGTKPLSLEFHRKAPRMKIKHD